MSNDENIEITSLVFDENEDGTLDNIVEVKRNNLNQICEVSVDFDGDGIADAKMYFEYDDVGRLRKKSKDKNMSGVINSVEIYEYDSNGNVIVKYDDNADGKVDYVEHTDEEGNVVVSDLRSPKQKIVENIQDMLPDAIKKHLEK